MKKPTSEQMEMLCECGHERHDHSDDIGGATTLKIATEECNQFRCRCLNFEKKKV